MHTLNKFAIYMCFICAGLGVMTCLFTFASPQQFSIELLALSNNPPPSTTTPTQARQQTSEVCLIGTCTPREESREESAFGSTEDFYAKPQGDQACTWKGAEVPCTHSALIGSWWNQRWGCWFRHPPQEAMNRAREIGTPLEVSEHFPGLTEQEQSNIGLFEFQCFDQQAVDGLYADVSALTIHKFYALIGHFPKEARYVYFPKKLADEPVSQSMYDLALKARASLHFPTPAVAYSQHVPNGWKGEPLLLVKASTWWWGTDERQWKPLSAPRRCR